jgi:23S rRNA pseudouridine1911/1915/1917 synthase
VILAAAPNDGWTYRDRVTPAEAGLMVSAFYAARYSHSDRSTWLQRLEAGEIACNGQRLAADGPLAAGDRLAWHRPPWREEAVPAAWGVVHDDGDLLVLDKPAGLPVLPAGGFLEHTALRLLERRHRHDPAGVPRPVHRLGRFTTGLLVCARRPATRAWLSALLRESTAAGAAAPGGAIVGCEKVYRALLEPGALALEPGVSRRFEGAIGRRPHPRLGLIWCAASAEGSQASGDLSLEPPQERPPDLPACSTLTLLERHPAADLVAVAIASGRPHQIRIHCAALGAPLLGDPLYAPGGGARPQALPGEGGYQLQAWRLRLPRPDGGLLLLEAPAALALTSAVADRAAPLTNRVRYNT